MVLRNRALDLGRGQNRGAQPLGEGDEPIRCLVPQHPEPREHDGASGAAKHVERNAEAAGVRLDRDPFAEQRRTARGLRRLGPGLVRGNVDVNRAGRRRRRGSKRPANLGPDRTGVERRLPLRDRGVEPLKVEDLPEPGLVGVTRVLVGQRHEGCAVQPGMGDAVDHVRRARPPGRGAHAGTAGDLAPGRGQHRARDLLLHQDVAHVARPRGVHQLDGLSPRVPGDERGAAREEGVGQYFDGGAHRAPAS